MQLRSFHSFSFFPSQFISYIHQRLRVLLLTQTHTRSQPLKLRILKSFESGNANKDVNYQEVVITRWKYRCSGLFSNIEEAKE